MGTKLLLIALAGACGTLSRYGLSGLVQRMTGPDFPWGTFAVNVVGSFLFGVVWAAVEDRQLFTPETRVIVLTGFMGAFTTFSTFMFESSGLIREGQWLLASGNILGQVAIGLAGLFLGLAAGRLL